MVDIPEQTAFLEFESEDKHCISFTELKHKDGTDYILIPEPIADLDYLNIKDGKVELYHNDDCFISIGAHTGQGLTELKVEQDEEGYWLEISWDNMDAIQPLNDTTHMPVLFLGCGELWILNNHDLWQKLSAKLETG